MQAGSGPRLGEVKCSGNVSVKCSPVNVTLPVFISMKVTVVLPPGRTGSWLKVFVMVSIGVGGVTVTQAIAPGGGGVIGGVEPTVDVVSQNEPL